MGILQLMQKVPCQFAKDKYFILTFHTICKVFRLCNNCMRIVQIVRIVRIVCESHIGTTHGVHERASSARRIGADLLVRAAAVWQRSARSAAALCSGRFDEAARTLSSTRRQALTARRLQWR